MRDGTINRADIGTDLPNKYSLIPTSNAPDSTNSATMKLARALHATLVDLDLADGITLPEEDPYSDAEYFQNVRKLRQAESDDPAIAKKDPVLPSSSRLNDMMRFGDELSEVLRTMWERLTKNNIVTNKAGDDIETRFVRPIFDDNDPRAKNYINPEWIIFAIAENIGSLSAALGGSSEGEANIGIRREFAKEIWEAIQERIALIANVIGLKGVEFDDHSPLVEAIEREEAMF